MKKILLETNISKIYIIVMLLISTLVIGGYFSYAMFTVTKEKKNAISIVTGNLEYKMTIDDEETNIIKIPKGTIKDFKVVLSNPNNRKARFNVAYKDIEKVTLGYLENTENIPPTEKGENLEQAGTSGSSNIYTLRVRNETSEDIDIELTVKVGLDYNDLKIDDDKKIIEKYENILLKEYMMKLKNEEDNQDYNSSNEFEQNQMYTFKHQAGVQQAGWTANELKDYRYIGENPNNYIKFNNELWRMLGVFTVEKQDGTKEQLVKIIRNESLGTLSWDANADKSYSDIWKNAEVQKMLNGSYLNSTTMTYYNYDFVSKVLTTMNLDFREIGLKDVSNLIESVKWYTAPYSSSNYTNILVNEMYITERSNASTTSGGGSNWIGKIGLIYPSDFSFTSAYNYNSSCYGKPIGNTDCENPYSWLPQPSSSGSPTITALSMGRNILRYTYKQLFAADSSRSSMTYPTLYLTSSIMVTNGSGTKEKPFEIALES